MAVSSEAIEFDSFHLVAEEYDALMRANGTRALIFVATLCACWNLTTGHRDPACKLCYPLGRIYAAPVEAWIHAPSRRAMKQVTPEGVVDTGDVSFTLPSTLQVSDGTRILIPDAIERVSDILTKGTEDVIRFTRVVGLDAAHRVVRTPPEGSPYRNERIPLEDGVDFTREDRTIVWPSDSPVPDGTRYVLGLQVQAEYVVWGEPRTRVENGKQMPSVYPVKRYDFLLHPKDEEGALTF